MTFQFPIILDGGFATELEKQFKKDLSGKLWSAQCLKDDPEAIKAVHKSYYKAGSNVATTCSYQASVDGFLLVGCSRELAIDLMRQSIRLAHEARDEFNREYPDNTDQRLVALSIGSYGAILADGSEYTGDYKNITLEGLEQFHRARLELFLANDSVDFILFETIPSHLESLAIARIAPDLPCPVAIAFQCCSDEHIADGSSLIEVLASFDSIENVFAVGTNCTKPRFIECLVNRLIQSNRQKKNTKALLLYPDSGEVWNAVERTWDTSYRMSEDNFGDLVTKCVRAYGPRVLVGGCCGTGPSHITRIKEKLLR